MVDRIAKALRKLNSKERKVIKRVLRQIKAGEVAGLDIKKLKGNLPIYRVRKGGLRVIYQVNKTGKVSVLAIERRSDTTYQKY